MEEGIVGPRWPGKGAREEGRTRGRPAEEDGTREGAAEEDRTRGGAAEEKGTREEKREGGSAGVGGTRGREGARDGSDTMKDGEEDINVLRCNKLVLNSFLSPVIISVNILCIDSVVRVVCCSPLAGGPASGGLMSDVSYSGRLSIRAEG